MGENKRGLVLAGGGARGSYQLGAWQALRDLNWKPDIVVGTSIGAINGAMVAADNFEGARKLWVEMTTSQIFNIEIDEKLPLTQRIMEAAMQFGKAAITQGGVDTGHLREVLASFLDEDVVRKSSIEYGLATTHMETLKPKEMFIGDIPNGELADYIIASAAIFPAVKPQEIENQKYVDGGFYNNLPIDMALGHGATEIVAVDLEAIGIVKKVGKLPEGTKVKYIRSGWDLGTLLVFDREEALRNMRLGYLDTMRAFDVFDGNLFTFIKGNLCEYYQENESGLIAMYSLDIKTPDTDGILARIHTFYSEHLKKAYDITPDRFKKIIESAGKIFALDPLCIYSVESFNEALANAFLKVEDNAKYTLRSFAKIMEKEKLVKSIYEYLKEGTNHKYLEHLASLFDTEFTIALYLMYIMQK